MVKTIKKAGGGGSTINAPEGIAFLPAPVAVSSGGQQLVVTLFQSNAGDSDRIVLVGVNSTSTVGILELKRLSGAWVFDPADCAFDTSVTLNVTAAGITQITAFGIDDPAGTGDRVLFISTNDAAQTPDTFEMDSIVLTPGSSTLSAVAVVIAGANQPDDANTMAVQHIPLSTIKVMSINEDDGHFADVTEAAGTYTFTYTDAKVLAIDTTINVIDNRNSGILIGTQVVLVATKNTPNGANMWEMSATAVLTEEFSPFATVGQGTRQEVVLGAPAAITAIGGSFAMAAPFGGSDAVGEEMAYIVATFDLDLI